jgi:hypothetical protein
MADTEKWEALTVRLPPAPPMSALEKSPDRQFSRTVSPDATRLFRPPTSGHSSYVPLWMTMVSPLVCPRIVSTDVDDLRLLAE